MSKRFCWLLGLSALLFTGVSLAASPILSIQPSASSLTLRSDGETSVVYYVTNESSQVIKNLQVTPGYHTTGQSTGFTLQNDSCSNNNLISQATCQFGVIISGANQPDMFSLSPHFRCKSTGYVFS